MSKPQLTFTPDGTVYVLDSAGNKIIIDVDKTMALLLNVLVAGITNSSSEVIEGIQYLVNHQLTINNATETNK